MRKIEWAPAQDWDALALAPTLPDKVDKAKAAKFKTKKPKKTSKQRLKGGR